MKSPKSFLLSSLVLFLFFSASLSIRAKAGNISGGWGNSVLNNSDYGWLYSPWSRGQFFSDKNVGFSSGEPVWKEGKSGNYTYKYVVGDPLQTRIYRLKNGLTVMLSPNKKEPRIAVRIAVRAGSNTDPKEHTGLAHYLEHMLFKGTDRFGTLDWQKEKPLLDQIDALYEQYNSTKDEARRKEIYKEIDRVSGEASKFSIANEYDKMMAAMGAQGTNAHTWVEETVYEEDIPSNAVDKFLSVQQERFRNPILRIFHTELEAVYEEKNRSLDNDGWKIQEAMHALLWPTHNYGQQTTIGTIEHLKNPSLKAIRDYYYTYYVPNNMAVVMAGDFNPDQLIAKIDAAFSYMKPKTVPQYAPQPEQPIKGPVVQEIVGPSAETMRIAYRTGKEGTREATLLTLVSSILSNGKAGLMDLNLNKQQKVLIAGAANRQYKDYGMFFLYANPKQGQPLEEVKDLLLAQIQQLKSGEFEESLIQSIVSNYKLYQLQSLDANNARVEELTDCYIKNEGKGWLAQVARLEEMAKVSKKELVEFANRFFQSNNYVVIYKRKGVDEQVVKVEKPAITPVETNAGKQSDFVKAINNAPIQPIQPRWINFAEQVKPLKVGIATLYPIKNEENDLFRLYYRFNMGSWNEKKLSLALQYLQFLGTKDKSSEEITRRFYQLAASFNTNAGSEELTLSISGLQEHFMESIKLFEDLIKNCEANEEALTQLKNRTLKSRANQKLNKSALLSGLMQYATYGADNPFNYQLSDDELQAITAQELVTILHQLFQFEHQILYYGPLAATELSSALKSIHQIPADWKPYPAKKEFKRRETASAEVYFAHYDMVQAELMWGRNLGNYNQEKESVVRLFNNYFGGGMGSIVFQTIRESKALAYSTYAFVNMPSKKEDQFTFSGYVGSQADKLPEAIQAMNELLEKLPASPEGFEAARASLIKDMETQRIEKDEILFEYFRLLKKGLTVDVREQQYKELKNISWKDVETYHQETLKNKPFHYAVIGHENNIKPSDLEKYGKVVVLNPTQIFGY